MGRARYGPGDEIASKYRLIRPLAEGGMGTVWVAHNVDLDVSVAVKLLRAELVSTHSDRLLDEARMLARLQHPAIVRVHDCGKTGHGDPFIVMELLDGESLADTLERRGRLSAIESVSLLLPVAEALRTAHDAGIVHRDVKPENVYLASVGGRVQPKVLDFGIALADFAKSRRTSDGAVLGSPAYMSPEQACGDAEIDASSDVWALSVVLYELLTGKCPFERDNYNATLRAIVDDEARSILAEGAGDELLATIVERGLEKDKRRRYPSADELGVALAQWLWSHGITEDASDVSLRTAWLHRTSEAPQSLNPVTVSRIPISSPTLERLALPSIASTEGVALSPTPLATKPGKLRIALGVAVVAAIGATAVAFWPRAPDPRPQPISASAERRERTNEAPAPDTVEPAKTPAPRVEADAGAPLDAPAAPRASPSEQRRPRAAPSPRPYRPRGI